MEFRFKKGKSNFRTIIMETKTQRVYYILGDYTAALLAWVSFYVFRKIYIEEAVVRGSKIFMTFELKFWVALFGIPLMWIFFYRLLGHYMYVYRRTRIIEFWQTFVASLIGMVVMFFFIILDDVVSSHIDYYYSFLFLFSSHFLFTLIFRSVHTGHIKRKIEQGKISFPTVIIGNREDSLRLYAEIQSGQRKYGYNIIGYIAVDEKNGYHGGDELPCIGYYHELERIVEQSNIREVIVTPEAYNEGSIKDIMIRLLNRSVYVNIIPEMYGIYSGRMKLDSILNLPVLQISPDNMPEWQQNLKRLIDIGISVFVITVFSPLFMFLAIGVRLSGKGRVFYSHKRIGRYGKPFTIYKFRSMRPDAEKDGPALSSKEDPRITAFGKFMRKYRLDEFPQFYNVLIGDMSLVGPRPERQFYIDKIVKDAPNYLNLQRIRPGITSLGQVKFGYAENVDEMIQRMRYDILYLQNMSLYLDFKILLQTILVVLGRKGV